MNFADELPLGSVLFLNEADDHAAIATRAKHVEPAHPISQTRRRKGKRAVLPKIFVETHEPMQGAARGQSTCISSSP